MMPSKFEKGEISMLTSEMIKQRARELGASVCGIGRVYDEPDAQRDPRQILPNAKSITVKIVACKDDGKILGAQAIGCGDASKRINSVAALLQAKGTIYDLLNLDLPYAPPYSPTIDALLSAGQIIFNKTYKTNN